MNQKALIIAAFALIAGVFFLFSKTGQTPDATTLANLKPSFAVKLPQFSGQQQKGQQKFEANCLACHGKHATGTGNGPPLIHK